VEITLQAPSSTLGFSSSFNEANAIPAGWTTYDSSEKRTGYSGGYSSGCRVLQFTGSEKGFTYGLYFRNINGRAKQGYAKLGLSSAGTTISLAPGHYTLKYKVCNWNQPNFTPVTVAIEKAADGQEVASTVYTPTVNLKSSTVDKFSTALQSFEFDIPETGDYVLAFYADAAKNADFVLGTLTIQAKSFTTDIKEIETTSKSLRQKSNVLYDLSGRRVADESKKHGIYIQGGRKVVY
jgi:hypothetical protein